MAAVAIPAVIAVAWQRDLFSGTPASFVALIAGIAGVASGIAISARLPALSATRPATIVAVAAALAFVAYCGPATAFATVLLGLCAMAILPERWIMAGQENEVVGLVAGLAILACVVGWLLPFPVHDGRAYLVCAALLCAWRRNALRQRIAALWAAWSREEQGTQPWLVFAVVASTIAGLGLWLPTMNYDDNAAHLILPYQLLRDGYYHLDVSTQAWSVAPWANNVLHGTAALLAGSEARAAVNALWLLIGLNGAWRLARVLGASPSGALAAMAVYASLPLTAYFTTTMQVDSASAAVLLQLAALLAASGRSLPPALLVGALMGLLAGLKASNVVYALPAILWLGWLGLRQRRPAWLLQVGCVSILLGSASYVYATYVTGNPLFPLFNKTFASAYFPSTDLLDRRWMAGVTWRSIWDLTFDTGRYGEHYPGAFGIALLALLPALCAEVARHPVSRAVACWFIVSGLLMFGQIQYMRYLFPALAILVVVGAVGLSRLLPRAPFAALLAVLVAANFLLLPTTSWQLRDNPWHQLVLQGASAGAVIEARNVPERAVLRRLLGESPHACIIIANPEAPFGGIAGGRAVVVTDPYDHRMAMAFAWANADPAGARWQEVLASTGASHVVTGAVVPAALAPALAARGFEKIDAESTAVVWASPDPGHRACGGTLGRTRDEAHRRLHPGDDH